MKHALAAIIFVVGIVTIIGIVFIAFIPGGAVFLAYNLCAITADGNPEQPIQCLREWSNVIAALAALLAGYLAWISVQIQLNEDRNNKAFESTHETLITLVRVKSTIDRIEAIDAGLHIDLVFRDARSPTTLKSLEVTLETLVDARKALMSILHEFHITYNIPIGEDGDDVFIALSRTINKYSLSLSAISDTLVPFINVRSPNRIVISEENIRDAAITISECSQDFRSGLNDVRKSIEKLSNVLDERLSTLQAARL